MAVEGGIPDKGSGDSLEESVISLFGNTKLELRSLFEKQVFDSYDGEGLVKAEYHFNEMMWMAEQTVPFMEPGKARKFISALSQRLSNFAGNELYAGNSKDNSMMDLENYAKKMHRIIQMKDKAYNGHRKQVSLARHCTNVGIYNSVFADLLEAEGVVNFSLYERELIEKAGSMHDLGKVWIPDHIITKKARLTDEEYAKIKPHSEEGASVVRDAGFHEVAAYIVSHHIRYDGKGYPSDVSSWGVDEQNPKYHMMAAADTFDAAARREYGHKKPLGFFGAVNELKKVAGTQLHPEVVETVTKKENIPYLHSMFKALNRDAA